MNLFTEDEMSVKIPKSPKECYVRNCEFGEISRILKEFHYKEDHIGGGIDCCLAMKFNGLTVGGVVIGKLRQDQAYSKDGKRCVELRRMALLDAMPKNSESWFLAQTIHMLKKHTNYTHVISYADKTVGHQGTIYKAANFKNIGETAPTDHVFWNGKRYHPRSLSIDRDYSRRLQEAIKTGEAKVETGLPKIIFEYEIKRTKRELNKMFA